MKDSRHSLSIRSLLAVIVVVGLSSLILHYAGGIYYNPICRDGAAANSPEIIAGAESRPGETTLAASSSVPQSDFRNLMSCDLCSGVSA